MITHPVLSTVAELRALNPGSIVVTGSGFEYVKKPNGRFHKEYASDTPPGWLLDPEHSKQPIRLIYGAES